MEFKSYFHNKVEDILGCEKFNLKVNRADVASSNLRFDSSLRISLGSDLRPSVEQ